MITRGALCTLSPKGLSAPLALALLVTTTVPRGAFAQDTRSPEEPTGMAAWLRSENDDVNDGNAQMKAGDPKGALAAYDRAAQSLPSDRGVHLNRGLSLMAQGDLPAAREALQMAARPPGKKAVRASAYYNLGNAFYKEADELAGEQDHEQAQQLFREAVESYKQTLRLSPSDGAAAWNLELASRRLTEEKQKQEQQDKQDQDKQDQDQDQQDQDKQNQDQDQQDQDKQNQDQQNQNQDPNKQDQQKQDQQKQDQQKQDQPKQDQQKQDQPKQDQSKQGPEQQPPPQPSDVERALDALQDGEDNLERHRAHQRAARERRRPEKDW